MNTLRIAIIPGLIAGIISVFTSWLWMGVIFHRFQKETPETWRAEGSRSYLGASLLHVFAAVGIACLDVLIVRFQMGLFAIGVQGSLSFAVCIWGALALPILLESAIFYSFASPRYPRPASRLAHDLCASLHHHMVVAWSDRPLAAVETYQKLTCHRMVDSDKSEEHEMCSHIRFARACVADVRRLASAVSS